MGGGGEGSLNLGCVHVCVYLWSELCQISSIHVGVTFAENPPSFVPGSEHHPAKEGATAEASGSAGNASETGNGAGDDIPSELPFQLQITYTDADGTKALRVLTQRKPVTKDRTVAEKGEYP